MGWSVACWAEGDRLSVDVFEAKGCEALLKALAGKGIAAVSRLSVFPSFAHTDFLRLVGGVFGLWSDIVLHQ